MSLVLIRGALEQGLLFSLTALGLYLSFRTLNIADMTVDGSFTLGAAVSATLVTLGHPFLALLCAVMAGSLAGLVSALLQTRLRIQSILAGIITMTGLYSINLRVMGGRSNVTLLRLPTVFSCVRSALATAFQPWSRLLVAAVAAALCGVLLTAFLRTRLGLSIRATGDNPAMVSASSINPQRTVTVGLCIANALPALSGALIAQYQQFCDITMGTGMVVIGLASLIIGEVISGVMRRPSVWRGVVASLLGGAVYWVIIAFAISSSISANDLKLLSALIVAVAISWPVMIARVKFQMKKKANRPC